METRIWDLELEISHLQAADGHCYENTFDAAFDQTTVVVKWASLLPIKQNVQDRLAHGARVLIAVIQPSTSDIFIGASLSSGTP